MPTLDTNKPIYLLRVEKEEKLELVLFAVAKRGFTVYREEDLGTHHFNFVFASPEQNLCGFCTSGSIVAGVGLELQPEKFFKKFKIQLNMGIQTPL